MEARGVAVWAALAVGASLGADLRTPNFVVSAATPELAQEVGREAERLRKQLAIEWLGREMPTWYQPCPIRVHAADHLGAGGETSFVFDRGHVFGWRMEIQGSRERLLDSVLPHEITHTVFASHFRQALPRWADEGACTTVEHPSEQARHRQMLVQFLQTNRGLAFNRMFSMMSYPSDIMPLYAQGHSVARYLIEQGGKRKYIAFVGDGLRDGNWPAAVRKHYGAQNLGELQTAWLGWVKQGSPPLARAAGPEAQLASASGRRPRPTPRPIYRAQSADPAPVRAVEQAPATDPPGSARVSWPPANASLARRASGIEREAAASNAAARARPGEAAPAATSANQARSNDAAAARAASSWSEPRQVLLEWRRPEHEPDGAPLLESRLGPSRWR